MDKHETSVLEYKLQKRMLFKKNYSYAGYSSTAFNERAETFLLYFLLY